MPSTAVASAASPIPAPGAGSNLNPAGWQGSPGVYPPSPAAPAVTPTAFQVPAATVPATPLAPVLSDLRRLQHTATTRYAALDSYIARLRRREQVNGNDGPEELVIFKFRKQPWSVYFKWLGTVGQGREVVYVKGQRDNQIHSILAAGDAPFMPAGKRMDVSPDSIFVRSASRHSITEAGIGNLVANFAVILDSAERGERRYGTLQYLGRQKRVEYEAPLDAVQQLIPAGSEAPLPRGGRRLWMFDPANGLPVLVTTWDEKGHEVEYYCYDHLQLNVKLNDDDFNPDKLWPSRR